MAAKALEVGRDPFYRPLEGEAAPYLQGSVSFGADGRLLASGGAGVGDGRRGAELWGTLRDGVGPNKADASWSLILEHIKRMRAQLKPVAQAAEEDAVDASAWVRSLRSKLRPVDRGLRKPSMY